MTDRGGSPEWPASLAAWTRRPSPVRLACGVQSYAWGERGPEAFIPDLLGRTPKAETAYAELWMGAHPSLPATAAIAASAGDPGAAGSLQELIAAAPEIVLGAAAVQRFGPELPFLAKVLTASQPLSIQAHPDKRQAEEGFAREEAAGVPRDAPGRNYRDRNHKPELIIALGDFYALDGFRPVEEIVAALRAAPELAPLLDLVPPPPAAGAAHAETRPWLQALFDRLMSPACAEAGAALDAWLARLRDAQAAQAPGPDDVTGWLTATAARLPARDARDRGLYAFLLLNFVHLRPGQALFLEAGRLHAYLEGRGLEVMANSDNVLRGGLTPKWVDLPELNRVLTFAAGRARVVAPDAGGVYPTPVGEFQAALRTLPAGAPPIARPGGGVALLLGVAGEAVLSCAGTTAGLRRGDVWLVPAAAGPWTLAPAGGQATVFQVTVPV